MSSEKKYKYYDFSYRELQSEHLFQWETFSPSMELKLLIPKHRQPAKQSYQPPTKN